MAMAAKDDRLQIRVAPERKRLLEEAAKSAHLSISAFVLRAAEQRAEEELLDRQIVRLAPKAAEAFAEALLRPADVNKRLAEALSRPDKISWVD